MSAFNGISIRKTQGALLFDVALKDGADNLLTSGTCTMRLGEVTDAGALLNYDFATNVFGTGIPATATLAMTHQLLSNTTNTGLFTATLSSLGGFTKGKTYMVIINNAQARPRDQVQKFLFGGAEGDMQVDPMGKIYANVGALHGDHLTANKLYVR